MNVRQKKTLISSAVIIFSLLVITGGVYLGCGSSPLLLSGIDIVRAYLGTQSPGDVWSWIVTGVDSGTFVATKETASDTYTYSGTFDKVPSGYKKFTVDWSDQGGLSLPADVYGLELPGTAFYVKDPAANVVVATAKRESLPDPENYVWVKIPTTSWSTSVDSYGTLEVLPGPEPGTYSLEGISYTFNDTVQSDWIFGPFIFADGQLTMEGSGWDIYIGANKVFAVDKGPGNGGYFGSEMQYGSVTGEAIGAEYLGISYLLYPTGTQESKFIGFARHPGIPWKSRLFEISDPETGTVNPNSYATWEFGSILSGNIWRGTLDEPSGSTTPFKMIISKINGKHLLSGIGEAADGRPYSVFAIEKD
jgi:hypothetical protein